VSQKTRDARLGLTGLNPAQRAQRLAELDFQREQDLAVSEIKLVQKIRAGLARQRATGEQSTEVLPEAEEEIFLATIRIGENILCENGRVIPLLPTQGRAAEDAARGIREVGRDHGSESNQRDNPPRGSGLSPLLGGS
jgi:hypothetical protein